MRAKCYTPGCQAGGFNTDTASGWSSVGLQLAFYLFSWSRTRHGFIVPTPSNYPAPCVYRALFSVKFMDIFSFLLFFSQTFICFNKLTIIDQKMKLSLKRNTILIIQFSDTWIKTLSKDIFMLQVFPFLF